MSISFEKVLSIHDDAFRLRTQRAGILANNLANADTPNFRARDIDFQQMLERATGGQSQFSDAMAQTHSKHFATGDQMPGDQTAGAENLLYRVPNQPAIDGNTVEEQVEHAEYIKNALAYQASFLFVNGRFKGLKTAISGEVR